MRPLNLALKFVLELAALAAFGYWGASVADGATAVLVAIGLPVAVAVLWGTFAAPRARRRLPLRMRAPFELGVFALAALALWAAGSPTLALAFAAVAAVNALLLTGFGQWEARSALERQACPGPALGRRGVSLPRRS
jgi:hypothetical protein